MVDIFGAFADPIRRDLMRHLAAGPARVVDLAGQHPISRPAVSKHLRLLTEAGITEVEERGRERHYRLRTASLLPLRELLAELQAPPFSEADLDGLDLEVRRTSRERRTSAATIPAPPPTEELG